MEGIKFNCEEDRLGNVVLYDVAGDKPSIYLQGYDATLFRSEWDDVIHIWEICGTKGEKSYGPFNSYSEQMDCIIGMYFDEAGTAYE